MCIRDRRYLDPEGYQNLIVKVGMKRAEREENIRCVINTLSDKLKEMNIHYEIDGRPKHFYSIYRKMVLQHKPFEQIFDLIAIRVLVDTVQDCYAAVSYTHLEELERRLRGRGTETEEKICQRLETAKRELPYAPKYDYQIVNGGDIDAAYAQLRAVFLKETGCEDEK